MATKEQLWDGRRVVLRTALPVANLEKYTIGTVLNGPWECGTGKAECHVVFKRPHVSGTAVVVSAWRIEVIPDWMINQWQAAGLDLKDGAVASKVEFGEDGKLVSMEFENAVDLSNDRKVLVKAADRSREFKPRDILYLTEDWETTGSDDINREWSWPAVVNHFPGEEQDFGAPCIRCQNPTMWSDVAGGVMVCTACGLEQDDDLCPHCFVGTYRDYLGCGKWVRRCPQCGREVPNG